MFMNVSGQAHRKNKRISLLVIRKGRLAVCDANLSTNVSRFVPNSTRLAPKVCQVQAIAGGERGFGSLWEPQRTGGSEFIQLNELARQAVERGGATLSPGGIVGLSLSGPASFRWRQRSRRFRAAAAR